MAMRLTIFAAVVAALAIGTAAANARTRASASWSAPIAVTEAAVPAGRISNLQVAVDESGTAVYLWGESDGVRTRVRTRACTAASCSAAEDLTNGANSVTRIALAMAADGTATAVWEYTNPSKISARVRTGGAWGAETDVSSVALRVLQGAAALANGGLVVLSTATANAVTSLGATSCLQRLTLCTTADISTPANSANVPRIATNGADKGAIAWVEQIGAGNRFVRYAPVTQAGAGAPAIGAAAAMSAETPSTKTRLAVDVDTNGLTTVAWVENNVFEALYVQRFADSAPPAAPPAAAVATTTGTIADDSLHIGSDAKAGSVVTWATSLNGAQTLSALPFTALTGGAQQTVTSDGTALAPALAVAGTGTGAIAYVRDSQIVASWAATLAGTWAVASPEPLAGTTASQPAIGSARDGTVVLAWVTASQATGEQQIRSSRLAVTPTAAASTLRVVRRARVTWTVSTRVTSTIGGTLRQVGRITVRGKRVVACRTPVRPIVAGTTTTFTCRLTRAATTQRRRTPLRIQLTTSLTGADGTKATKQISVRLPRKR